MTLPCGLTAATCGALPLRRVRCALAWSPDGRRILFSSARYGLRDEALMYDGSPQPYAELFVMRATARQRPSPMISGKRHAAWAP
jgi:hypothetical protein